MLKIKMKLWWTPLAVLALWTGAARAEEPAPSPQMQKHQLQTQQRFQENQANRVGMEKKPSAGPWMYRAPRALASNEIEVRIEDLRDGALLYSVPMEKGQEKVVKEVKTRAEIQSRRLFQGRYYRQVRAAAQVDWRSMIGKEVRLRLESSGGRSGGSLAVSAKVK